jgi:dienelactone hydrolase
MPHDPLAPAPAPAAADLSRRDFVSLSVGGTLALGGVAAHAALPVVEREVAVRTPDGSCDAAFFHPASGSHPGVLVWPDAFGLRPSMRAIGRRLAGEGYAVLVPNPYYRVARAPQYDSAANIDFRDPETMKKLGPLRASVVDPGHAERDATAYVAFLDAQPQVDQARKIGTQGYCMGGALVMRSAATLPAADRRGRVVPRRRPRHRQTRQPAPARAEDRRADVLRRREERRRTPARREGGAEAGLRVGARAGAGRGLSGVARLVRRRHAQGSGRCADLRRGRSRARVGAPARAVPAGLS